MCGRYTLSARRLHRLEERLHTTFADLTPRYNIAPSQEVPVIRKAEDGYALVMARWGLIPSWAKDPKTGYRMINARAETVAEKPAFRSAFRHRRCLIPADGMYEWRQTNGHKTPYYICMQDRQPFAFAGLWEHWQGGSDEAIESCSIIVTEANTLIQPIHDRMPVILSPEDYRLWLDPTITKAEPLQALLRPYPAEAMEAYPVSARVNSPKNDAPDLLNSLSGA
jgi:putative SOS response-associated peptidase YedK